MIWLRFSWFTVEWEKSCSLPWQIKCTQYSLLDQLHNLSRPKTSNFDTLVLAVQVQVLVLLVEWQEGQVQLLLVLGTALDQRHEGQGQVQDVLVLVLTGYQNPSCYPACLKGNTTVLLNKTFAFHTCWIQRKFTILQHWLFWKIYQWNQLEAKSYSKKKLPQTFIYTAKINVIKTSQFQSRYISKYFVPPDEIINLPNRKVHLYVPLLSATLLFSKLWFMTIFDLSDDKSNAAIIECILSL